MLLRFDGRNQKRIAMISFFVRQFGTNFANAVLDVAVILIKGVFRELFFGE